MQQELFSLGFPVPKFEGIEFPRKKMVSSSFSHLQLSPLSSIIITFFFFFFSSSLLVVFLLVV
jgi:hypothetical protein